MIYREIKPSENLAQYVKLIWILEYNPEENLAAAERIVADGIVELVFHFGLPYNTIYHDGVVEEQPGSFIIAQLNNPIQIQPNGKTGIIAVRFYPWGAYHFFDKKIKEIGDCVVDTKYLWKEKSDRLENEIRCAKNNSSRVRLIEEFLLNQLQKNNKESGIENTIRYIHKANKTNTINEIATKFGFTKRTLERFYESTIGISPKHFSRLTRFLKACDALRDGDYDSISQLAYSLGFYDHSHLIKDFTRFSGVTPTQFCKDNNVTYNEVD